MSTLSLITHVNNYQFVGLVFESVQLRNDLVTPNVCCWEVNSFSDSPEIILLWVSQVQEQEASLICDSESISSVGDSRDRSHLTLLGVLRLGIELLSLLIYQTSQTFALLAGCSNKIHVSHLRGLVAIEIVNALLIRSLIHHLGKGAALNTLVSLRFALSYQLVAYIRLGQDKLTDYVYILRCLSSVPSQLRLHVSVLLARGYSLLDELICH